MITLKNINIRFQKEIIHDGTVSINDGQITSIIGESGSGKTSLLYLLGLLSSHECRYHFDGKDVDLKNDRECSHYRKTKIGYIFQDNNINDQLTVAENIANCSMIAGERMDEACIQGLLSNVGVDADSKNYPLKLSVGERQRVAIACALAKKPTLLIADEPTSALDDKNAEMVMDIFREFVKKPGNKVVIATHSKEIYNQTDVIYKIENGSVRAVTREFTLPENRDMPEQIQIAPQSNKKNGMIQTQLRYALKRTQKDKGRKRVVLFLLGFTIACTILSSVMGERFAGDQAKLVNDIAENEILVINNTYPQLNSRVNSELFLALSVESLDSFSKIGGVHSVYPLYEFPAMGQSRSERITSTSIEILRGSESIRQISFTEDAQQAYTVLPYWEWQNFGKKAIVTNSDVQTGVYISEVLARELGIQDVNGMTIRFDASVPFALAEAEAEFSDGDKIIFDYDICIKKEFEFPVLGVLDASVVNRYSTGGKVIYMGFDSMEEAFKVTQSENSLREKESPWAPSAVIMEVSDLSLLDHVREKLLALDPNYSVIIPVQDSQAMIQMVEGVRNWATGISIVLLIIISFFMFVVYLNQTDARKYEIAMLRANGFRKSEVAGLLCIEALIDALRVALIALILSFVVCFSFHFILYLPLFDFGWQTILLLLGVSIITISLPTLIILTRINRFNPDKLMRN